MERVDGEIERVKVWFYQQLDTIRNYPSENHRMILIVSLLDSFAQDYNNFERTNNHKQFVEFIQNNSIQYGDILKTICPITLYYGYLMDKNDARLKLERGRLYLGNDPEVIMEGKRLLEEIAEEGQGNARWKHSYAGLIYQLRNKLVHEGRSLNMPLNFLYDLDEQLPHMGCENLMKDGKLVFHRWALCIPEKFVVDVAVDVVENYLRDCLNRNCIPFGNSNRKCFKAWYD